MESITDGQRCIEFKLELSYLQHTQMNIKLYERGLNVEMLFDDNKE